MNGSDQSLEVTAVKIYKKFVHKKKKLLILFLEVHSTILNWDQFKITSVEEENHHWK